MRLVKLIQREVGLGMRWVAKITLISKVLGQLSQLLACHIRKDFAETAFFYPQLQTDKDGYVSFKFKMPESLTKWRFLILAHTKDLKTGYLDREIITQKKFSISPNIPRFLRKRDNSTIIATINNITNEGINGTATIAATGISQSEQIGRAHV